MRAPFRLATVIGVLALVVTAAPAQADTRTRTDPAGDAPAAIDLTRARYSYGDGRVSVVARAPGLGRTGTAALSISRFEIFEAGYVVRLVKRPGQAARTRLLFFDHFDLEPRPCDDVRGRWRAGVVRLSVASECLTGHARRRAFTQVALKRGQEVDFAPAVRRLRRD